MVGQFWTKFFRTRFLGHYAEDGYPSSWARPGTIHLLAFFLLAPFALALAAGCAGPGERPASMPHFADLARLRAYESRRVSSRDPGGGNDDGNWGAPLGPGERRVIGQLAGPGIIRHFWFTLSSRETAHLKNIVLRLTWDDAAGPSVLVPIGDFFGLNLGEYVEFESSLISVGQKRALNAFFPMPFRASARIELENQGRLPLQAFYFNVDYERYDRLPDDLAYFHAAYNQATPTPGTITGWKTNRDPRILQSRNVDGAGNYVILDTRGRGHFIGVTHGIVQKQPDWWGEGDEMFFFDDEPAPRVHGTGAEDYYLGAWCYGSCTGTAAGRPFAYSLYGNPLNGGHRPGARWLVYRFHVESPPVFQKALRVTIEHGHANHRSDDYFTVAYWYQVPARALSELPPAAARVAKFAE